MMCSPAGSQRIMWWFSWRSRRAYSFVRKVAWGFVSDFAGTDCCGVGSFLGGEWGVEGSGDEWGEAEGCAGDRRAGG